MRPSLTTCINNRCISNNCNSIGYTNSNKTSSSGCISSKCTSNSRETFSGGSISSNNRCAARCVPPMTIGADSNQKSLGNSRLLSRYLCHYVCESTCTRRQNPAYPHHHAEQRILESMMGLFRQTLPTKRMNNPKDAQVERGLKPCRGSCLSCYHAAVIQAHRTFIESALADLVYAHREAFLFMACVAHLTLRSSFVRKRSQRSFMPLLPQTFIRTH